MPTASTRIDECMAAFTGSIELHDIAVTARDTDAEALKFSRADAVLRGECSATGGRENACDVNNSSSVVVTGTLKLIDGEQSGLLVKGGSSFATTEAGFVVFSPSSHSRVDVLVDDWSDQSTNASSVCGDFRRADGKPVRVAFGRWRKPIVYGPSAVDWLLTVGMHVYNIVKGAVRFVLRIPAGVKGPAWL